MQLPPFLSSLLLSVLLCSSLVSLSSSLDVRCTKLNVVDLPSRYVESNADLKDAVALNVVCGEQSPFGNIKFIDTKMVTDMSFLFANSDFNDDIGLWDVSQVTDMKMMFYGSSKFDSDLSRWRTSSVTDMWGMFAFAKSFKGKGLETWDTSHVSDLSYMFFGAETFAGDVSRWQTHACKAAASTFKGAKGFKGEVTTNGYLKGWDISEIDDADGVYEDLIAQSV